jgi:hypothetical protein
MLHDRLLARIAAARSDGLPADGAGQGIIAETGQGAVA